MIRGVRWCLKLGIVCSLLLLTGCLQYDLGIQFDSETHGLWVQHLQWPGGAIAADRDAQRWLAMLETRTQAVGGKTAMVQDDTFEIAIPFNNGQELEAKFNQFFASMDGAQGFELPTGESLQALLTLQQTNWLLAVKNHLNLNVDLSAVTDFSTSPLPLLQRQQLFSGQVVLTAPWLRSPNGAPLEKMQWTLRPGQINEIDTSFWVPSPIGIGAIVIVIMVAIGYLLKYGVLARR